MEDLTAFQRDLLRVIGSMEDEPKGLEVKSQIESYYGEEINHGRLYPNLDSLVQEGLIEKGEVDGRTNKYILTRNGMQKIRVRDEWNEEHYPESFQDPLTTQL